MMFKDSKLLFSSLFLSCVLITRPASAMVDMHSHYIGDEYVKYLSDHNALLKEGFPLPAWSKNELFDFMKLSAIDTSVLTLAPIHPYFDNHSGQFIRTLNQNMAAFKNSHKGIMFCATLPLTDVKSAIEEAEYALVTLKADGISLGSNIDGQYLGDPDLDPLMEVLNEHHSVVIVHPHKPFGLSDRLFKTTPLAMYEYPADTTRAVVNMIMHNLMVRYPNIRFVIPHAGAFLSLTIPRMKAIYPVVHDKNLVGDLNIKANVSKLYFDLAGVQSVSIIKNMLSFTDVNHIVYGSDYPYFKKEFLLQNIKKLKEEIKADPDLSPYFDRIFEKNALAMFKVDN